MHERSIFAAALEITDPAERAAYLNKACGNNTELRQRLEELLTAQDKLGSFLTPPDDLSQRTTLTEPIAERPGGTIGPYKLVDLLGEGGMGLVFVAEQQQPVRRKVALKVIKPGMDSAQIIARFETERQALTLMEHPNIARVFDAGATAQGRPYFVMEYVEGVPITLFCDQNRLTIRERLQLFTTVCQAIQHAHQKGVIHRDIKPSNVLAAMQDGKPTAKVIDFGLAKATDQPLTDHSQLTAFGAIVGTLEYMSPEQAAFNSQGVDTRTDVYSLGVILYELLTGTRPLDRNKRSDDGFADMLQRIRDEEPPRPSARLANLGPRLEEIAANRKAEPARLAKLLRGELDWIVLKALEKDRERRYESASGLANDVQRYLNDEPVEACPPAAMYQMGKFARKNRGLLAAGGGIVTLLVVGVVWLSMYSVKLDQALKRARKAEYWTSKALKISDAVNAVLTGGSLKLDDWEKKTLRNVLEEHRQFLVDPGDSWETVVMAAASQFRAASLSALIGERAEAETGYRKAIELYEKLANQFNDNEEYRDQLARCNFDLGLVLNTQGKRSDAVAAYRRAIDLYEKLSSDFPSGSKYRREMADAYNNLGTFLRDSQELAKAEKAFRQAIALRQKEASENPKSIQLQIKMAAFQHNLGNVVRDQGNAKSALVSYDKAIGLILSFRTISEDAKLYLRNAYWDRANALGQLDRHGEAVKDWQRAIALDTGTDREHLRHFLAASQIEESLKAQDKPTGRLLYQAATVHARATAAATAAGELGLQKQYVRRALELLKQAKAAGYFTNARSQQLKENRDFGPLRKEPAFREFVKSLEAGKKDE